MTPATTPADIRCQADIITLVNSFCYKLSNDELLAPLYNAAAQIHWPHHLTSMYHFWGGVVFGPAKDPGHPLPPHLALPPAGPHLQRCLSLLQTTVAENFAGEKAEQIQTRVRLVGQ